MSDRNPSVDPRISRWVEWLVSKEPSDRPQSAGEAWDALEETLITTLGPHWTRAAPLLEPGELPTAPARPPPPPTVAVPVAAPDVTFSERPTGRLDDALECPDHGPDPPRASAQPPGRPSSGKHRWRPFVIGAVTAVAVIAMIAAALSPSGGTAGVAAGCRDRSDFRGVRRRPDRGSQRPPEHSSAEHLEHRQGRARQAGQHRTEAGASVRQHGRRHREARFRIRVRTQHWWRRCARPRAPTRRPEPPPPLGTRPGTRPRSPPQSRARARSRTRSGPAAPRPRGRTQRPAPPALRPTRRATPAAATKRRTIPATTRAKGGSEP